MNTLEEDFRQQALADWKKDAKTRDDFGGNFEAFFHYRKAEADGKVKILGQHRVGAR